MKVLVCGGRHYNNARRVFGVLDALHAETPIGTIITGAATGADEIAEEWAQRREIEYIGCPARWKAHGNAAGPIRNRYMLERHEPDLVVAFPGGSGTTGMVRLARERSVKVSEYRESDSGARQGK